MSLHDNLWTLNVFLIEFFDKPSLISIFMLPATEFHDRVQVPASVLAALVPDNSAIGVTTRHNRKTRPIINRLMIMYPHDMRNAVHTAYKTPTRIRTSDAHVLAPVIPRSCQKAKYLKKVARLANEKAKENVFHPKAVLCDLAHELAENIELIKTLKCEPEFQRLFVDKPTIQRKAHMLHTGEKPNDTLLDANPAGNNNQSYLPHENDLLSWSCDGQGHMLHENSQNDFLCFLDGQSLSDSNELFN